VLWLCFVYVVVLNMLRVQFFVSAVFVLCFVLFVFLVLFSFVGCLI